MSRSIDHPPSASSDWGELPFTISTPFGCRLTIRRCERVHRVLGAVDEIVFEGEVVTVFGRTNWHAPAWIPPLWRPASLPPGAGTALLNHIANMTLVPLAYRGPYPTAALYQSLCQSFIPDAPMDAFVERGETSAVLGVHHVPPVLFTPAPFDRKWFGDVCVQFRRGAIEAVFVCGHRFSPRGHGGRKLLKNDGRIACVLEVGGRVVAEIISLNRDGSPISEPTAPRPLDFDFLGTPLPAQVSSALWTWLEERAPLLLRNSIRAISVLPIHWIDGGLEDARADENGFGLHASFASSELDGAELLESLALALEPVVFRFAQTQAESSHGSGSPLASS